MTEEQMQRMLMDLENDELLTLKDVVNENIEMRQDSGEMEKD